MVEEIPSFMLITAKDIEGYHRRLVQQDRLKETPVTGCEITLTAAIELACIRHWANAKGLSSRLLIEPTGSAAWTLLDRSGWPSAKRAIELTSHDTCIKILPSKPKDRDWRRFVYETQRNLVVAGFSVDSARAIVAALGEMVDNVWNHSMTDTPGLVARKIQGGRVTFCIADVGIGVLESLRLNPSFSSLKTSIAALNEALKNGVSRFQGKGHGYGFSDLVRGVANQWGIARLRTGEGSVVLNHTTEELTRHSSYALYLPGLQVAFTCGTRAPACIVVL